MYYTLHARLKKTEPDYKSDLNLFQTDPVHTILTRQIPARRIPPLLFRL